jgi:hypothetical protein
MLRIVFGWTCNCVAACPIVTANGGGDGGGKPIQTNHLSITKYHADTSRVKPWYTKVMKHKPEYVEGPEAFTRFRSAMQKVLAVPHSEIQRRIEAARHASSLNPNKRGPKPKGTPAAEL